VLRELDVKVQWILETHVHAITVGSALPQAGTGGRLGIGRHITTVQQVFGSLINASSEFARDGRQFDHLFADGENFSIGSLKARMMHAPGHTPARMTYVVSDDESVAQDSSALVGDTHTSCPTTALHAAPFLAAMPAPFPLNAMWCANRLETRQETSPWTSKH